MLVSGHVTATMMDKKKGSLTNRWECAKEHMKNDCKTGTKVILGTGSVVGTAILAKRGKKLLYPPMIKVFHGFEKTATKTGNTVVKKLSKFDKLLNAASKFTYKALDKIGCAIGFFASKIGAKNMADKLLKNPTKTGMAAVLVIGSAYVLNKIAQYFTNKGRIDQKYEDAAKIESQTKNIVLAKMQALEDAQELGFTA